MSVFLLLCVNLRLANTAHNVYVVTYCTGMEVNYQNTDEEGTKTTLNPIFQSRFQIKRREVKRLLLIK